MKLKLFSLVAAFALLSSSVASAATFTTGASALPSSLTFELYVIGEDEETGDPIELVLTTIGPLGINGSLDATVALDGSGNGSFSYNGSSLILDDGSGSVELEGLGGFDLNFNDVGISLNSDAIAVSSNVWDLDLASPAFFELILNQGGLLINNVTGALPGLGLEDPTIIDLVTDPVAVTLDDLLGFGIFGSATETDLSLIIPGISIDIGAAALEIPDFLYLRITGEVNATLVPEPATYALLGMGILGMIPVVRRRLRK